MGEFDDYCSLCGIALRTNEIAADIRGDFVTFDDRGIGSIQMTLCADCLNKVIEIGLRGMDGAVARRIGLDDQPPIGFSKKARKEFKKKKDDRDEGDGGIDIEL